MNFLKKGFLFFFLAIVLVTALFLIQPQYWLKVINPIGFKIKTVDTKINDKSIMLDFEVLLQNSYFLNYFIDSLAYQIYFDSTQFSSGSTVINQQFQKGQIDTLQMPLTINRDSLKDKMSRLEKGDSTNLRIEFSNFIDLPITGKTKFKTTISKNINAPQIPEIEVLNVEKDYLARHDAEFTITFAITNPNNYTIAIHSIKADILFDDLFNGKAYTNEKVIVKPKETTQFNATINIDKLELVKDGLRVVFRPNKEWDYTIHSTLYIEQKDSSLMEVNITHQRSMNLMERRKEQKKDA